jgi:hypothetical protein
MPLGFLGEMFGRNVLALVTDLEVVPVPVPLTVTACPRTLATGREGEVTLGAENLSMMNREGVV